MFAQANLYQVIEYPITYGIDKIELWMQLFPNTQVNEIGVCFEFHKQRSASLQEIIQAKIHRFQRISTITLYNIVVELLRKVITMNNQGLIHGRIDESTIWVKLNNQSQLGSKTTTLDICIVGFMQEPQTDDFTQTLNIVNKVILSMNQKTSNAVQDMMKQSEKSSNELSQLCFLMTKYTPASSYSLMLKERFSDSKIQKLIIQVQQNYYNLPLEGLIPDSIRHRLNHMLMIQLFNYLIPTIGDQLNATLPKINKKGIIEQLKEYSKQLTNTVSDKFKLFITQLDKNLLQVQALFKNEVIQIQYQRQDLLEDVAFYLRSHSHMNSYSEFELFNPQLAANELVKEFRNKQCQLYYNQYYKNGRQQDVLIRLTLLQNKYDFGYVQYQVNQKLQQYTLYQNIMNEMLMNLQDQDLDNKLNYIHQIIMAIDQSYNNSLQELIKMIYDKLVDINKKEISYLVVKTQINKTFSEELLRKIETYAKITQTTQNINKESSYLNNEMARSIQATKYPNSNKEINEMIRLIFNNGQLIPLVKQILMEDYINQITSLIM